MANETTTSLATELILTEVVNREVIRAAYAEVVAAPLVRVKDIADQPTLTATFPKYPKLTASALTEGTDMSNTAVNTTGVSIDAGEVGLMVTITDLLKAAAVNPITEDLAQEMGRAIAEKIDTDITAEFANFSLTAGTSGADMTLSDLIDAVYALENANAPGPYVAILHPIQIADLRKDIVSNAATAFSLVPDSMKQALLAGGELSLEIMGVQIFRSTTCASVNTNADRQGGMFPARDLVAPIGMALKQVSRTEFQRDASLRATEVVVTSVYGVGTINAAWGVKIVTDHE